MKLTLEELKERKKRTAIRFFDESGNPISEEAKSVAVQDKRDSCDINRIVKKIIRKDGQIDIAAAAPLIKNEGFYGDFTNSVDYQELNNRVIRMNSAFMQLAPEIRMRFENNPAKLLDYLEECRTNPQKKKEAIELGILSKPIVKFERLDLPEGSFWIKKENGIEVSREAIKTAAPSPGA